MGKKKNKIITKYKSSVSLENQITKKSTKRKDQEKFRDIVLRADSDDEGNGEYIDSKTSKRIFRAVEAQRMELQGIETVGKVKKPTQNIGKSQGVRFQNVEMDSDEDSEPELDNDDEGDVDNEVDAFRESFKMSEEDERALALFQKPSEATKTFTLADMIMEKISERKTEMQSQFSDNLAIEEIDPRVKEMYEGVKDVAHRYRSGKLPKAFKVIPKLKNWEQILLITEPHNWSSSAIYEGTKMFSHAASTMFQRFLNLVLLPRVRDDMAEFNKLNPYLYRALKKSIYKPAAFFKGLILPLLTYGDCTLREAIIFGSVISKSSIPVLHAAACLLKISEMEYTGSNSIFLRIFFGKAYALPYRVIGENEF